MAKTETQIEKAFLGKNEPKTINEAINQQYYLLVEIAAQLAELNRKS